VRSEQGSLRTGRFRLGMRATLLIAGVFVLVFWVLLLGQAEHSVFGRVPILDEVYYLDRAAEISAGAPIPTDPFFMSPLYPFLIAAVGGGGGVPAERVFAGPELRGLRLMQACFWLATLVLIHLLATCVVPDDWRDRRRQVGVWLPVALFALYRPAVVYALAVLLESALVFLVTLAVYLTARIGTGSRRSIWVLILGVILGLAGLLRGTALLLLPVVLGVLWLQRGDGRLLRQLALLFVGLSVVLAPPVIHNSRVAGRLVGPSLNGGVNLYIGNGPEANGFYVAAIPGDWRHDPAGRAFLAERLHRTEVSLAAADGIWAGEAWHEMCRRPWRTLALAGRKIWLQLQGWEIDQLTPLAGWTKSIPLLRILVTPYALLVVLGMAGLTVWRGKWVVILLAVVLVVLLLGQSLFFVVSRYRLVLAPLWAVLAGIGAVRLFARCRLAWVVALVAILVTVPWGLNTVRTSWAALAQANEALRWADIGEADNSPVARRRAESLYRQSLLVEPDRPASWLGLAAVLGADGRADEQAVVLSDGLGRVADPFPLQKALLAVELSRDELTAALELARTILDEHPHDADTLHNVSVLLARSGQSSQALAAARELCRIQPDDPRGYVDVGVLLARSGHRREARAAFREGLRHCPGHLDLLQNLSLVEQ